MSEYNTVEDNGVMITTCPKNMDCTDPSKMEAQVKTWQISTCQLHVFDFAQVMSLKSTCYRYFVLYNQSLKQNAKAMFCINVNPKLLPQIRQDGLTGVFIMVKDVNEAKQKMKGASEKPKLDVEFIKPFIQATKTVLETQAQTSINIGKVYLRQPNEVIPIEIAGIIALNSKEFKGNICLCFKAEVFLKIYENMVGEKHTSISPEIEDAAGELLNIIFGQVKTVLNDQKGYSLEKAIPTVLSGERLRLQHNGRSPSIILPFESSAGQFFMEIAVDSN